MRVEVALMAEDAGCGQSPATVAKTPCEAGLGTSELGAPAPQAGTSEILGAVTHAEPGVGATAAHWPWGRMPGPHVTSPLPRHPHALLTELGSTRVFLSTCSVPGAVWQHCKPPCPFMGTSTTALGVGPRPGAH